MQLWYDYISIIIRIRVKNIRIRIIRRIRMIRVKTVLRVK